MAFRGAMLGEASRARRERLEEEWLFPAPLPRVLVVGVFIFALFVAVFRLIGMLPFNIFRLRWQKGATQGLSVNSFHQQDLLAVINLV
jgi:hypothetical protein